MSSVNRIAKGKAGTVDVLHIIIGAVLILAVVFVLIYLNVSKTGAASKFTCKVGLGVAEGYCISDKEKCDGITNPLGSGCPKEKPVCCVGQAPKDASGGDAAKPAGTVEFYCKCELKGEYLEPTTTGTFNKIEFPDTRAGGVDFKIKKDTQLEMQIRGTDAVKFCRIEIASKDKKSSAEETCSKDGGPTRIFKFENADEFDIILEGYDKQNGNLIASAIGDVSVEGQTDLKIVFDLYDNGQKINEEPYFTNADKMGYEFSCSGGCIVEVDKEILEGVLTKTDELPMGSGDYVLDENGVYVFIFKYKEGGEWKVYEQHKIQQITPPPSDIQSVGTPGVIEGGT